MSVKLQMQLENLEQKIGILTARLNQGDEWKRHLEFWLLDQLGMKFPDHLSMSDKSKTASQASSSLGTSTDNNKVGAGTGALFKENDENQCSNVVKNNHKRSLTPDGKSEGKPNKRRISSGINNNDKPVVPVVTNDPGEIVTKEEEVKTTMPVSQPESESSAKEEIESVATSSPSSSSTYIIQPSESRELDHSHHHPTAENEGIEVKYEPVEIETVHSPPANNEVQVKCEPIEIENVPEAEPEDATTTKNESSESNQVSRELPEEQQGGGNNVLHILKIDTEPLGEREPTVINYRQTLPIVQLGNVQSGSGNNTNTNSSQLTSNTATVFSGTIGADATTTTIGILNADGTITPCRQHVIISSSSGKVAVTTGEMQFKVVLPLSTTSVPLPTSTTTVTATTPKAATVPATTDDSIDPKGTFVCSICDNKFQGLYLFRQHEKKSDCRRLAKIAKLKKSNNNIKNNNVVPAVAGSSIIQPQDKPSLSKLPPAVPTYVAAPPDNLSLLKFKCHICHSNYASSSYLKFHLSKIHNIP